MALKKISVTYPSLFVEGEKYENTYDKNIFQVERVFKHNSAWQMDVRYIRSHTKSKATYIQDDIMDAVDKKHFIKI